jgi:hypothetical protein
MLLLAISLLLIVMMLGSVAWFRLSRSATLWLAASLWILYVPYEYLMYRRSLCSGECNIRVDLLVIYPVLLLVTLAAIGRLLWSWGRDRDG